MFALLQAEAADRTDSAYELAPVRGEKRLRAVFYDRNASLVRERHNVRHLTRIAKEVGNDDCLCASAKTTFDRIRSDVICARIDIRKHRDGALVENRSKCPHVRNRS